MKYLQPFRAHRAQKYIGFSVLLGCVACSSAEMGSHSDQDDMESSPQVDQDFDETTDLQESHLDIALSSVKPWGGENQDHENHNQNETVHKQEEPITENHQSPQHILSEDVLADPQNRDQDELLASQLVPPLEYGTDPSRTQRIYDQVIGFLKSHPSDEDATEVQEHIAIHGHSHEESHVHDHASSFFHNESVIFGDEIIESLKKASKEIGLSRRMVFPLMSLPLGDYISGGREFGAMRDGGYRYHAAADLIYYPSSAVHAITSGVIIDYGYFYQSTRAVVVDHTDFVIRYGEIDYFWDESLYVGKKVKTAEKLAGVGQLWSNDSMLHIEQYAGTSTGPLTVISDPQFKRRDDLIDVTPLLISLEDQLPQDYE